MEYIKSTVSSKLAQGVLERTRDVNGAEIDRMILYHSLFRHLKYSPSSSQLSASGRILPPSSSPQIPTVLADIHQL
jgi:hypothetical protein